MIIYPGEFYATDKDELISTVLGSCVSIALYDETAGVGGMNHFMLSKDNRILYESEAHKGKYGEYALDLLVADMLKKGSQRENLKAKVFGGSNVFNVSLREGAKIGDVNAKFAFEVLEKAGIPVTVSDTGGPEPRKIYFDPKTAKTYLKRIKGSMQVADEEMKCLLDMEKSLELSGSRRSRETKTSSTARPEA